MTKANRRACRSWSQKPGDKIGNLKGYCELCQARTTPKNNGLFVCTECGLEQPFHPL